MQTITVLYTEGCPGAPEALRIAQAVAASDSGVTFESIVIDDPEPAASLGFRGSPTVLVDGVDVERTPASPVGTLG